MATASPPRHTIRFTRTADGLQLAFADSGAGYPVIQTAHWITTIEGEEGSPIWAHWIADLAKRYRLIRYDGRGCGLSERKVTSVGLGSSIIDLEAIVAATNPDRFALVGMSQGGAAAIAYAAAHPERVSHLVLVGAYARGAFHRDPRPETRVLIEATASLIELGWGQENPAFLQMFTSQFFPGATLEQMNSFNELQRASTSPAHAAAILRAFSMVDATDLLANIRCPTLIMHCRGDGRVPFEEGRRIAAAIANARLEPLDSRNHVPLRGEPSFDRMLAVLHDFLPHPEDNQPPNDSFATLTPRERDIVELIARGLDNAQIAAHLTLSEKTVRNNITAIFDKLAVENRGQAIVRAREAGLGRGERR